MTCKLRHEERVVLADEHIRVLMAQESRSVQTLLNLEPDRDTRLATQSRPSAGDQQFARFLEAADRLGENLESNFAMIFTKPVVNPPRSPTTTAAPSRPEKPRQGRKAPRRGGAAE
jgi:hypothetical protein